MNLSDAENKSENLCLSDNKMPPWVCGHSARLLFDALNASGEFKILAAISEAYFLARKFSLPKGARIDDWRSVRAVSCAARRCESKFMGILRRFFPHLRSFKRGLRFDNVHFEADGQWVHFDPYNPSAGPCSFLCHVIFDKLRVHTPYSKIRNKLLAGGLLVLGNFFRGNIR